MRRRLYLIAFWAAIALSGFAQTIGEAFYIYRNDGQFNAFFRDEVISIEYSYEDAEGNTYDEIVTQIVNTADSIYKIPIAAIDSVGFVQPETIINNEVFPLTAEHAPYITNADVLSFTMSSSTPDVLRPKVGNIVVATAECAVFPNGIIARVEEISNSGSGYQYTCCQAYYDEVFDQLITYQPDVEGVVSADATRGFDLRRASLTATLWDVNWTRTIEGGATTTTLNVGDRGTATVTVCKTLTTPFYFQLQFQNNMTSSVGFNATSTASISNERQIGQTITAGRITIPYTMGLLWLEPKLSLFGYFEEQGKVELNYSGHFNRTDKVTFTYTQGKWDFSHSFQTELGTDVASLSMEGSAEIGLKPQIDFSLNGQQAGFGLNARVGMKEYINFVFDMTNLSDGSLYDAMRDSYCRTTIPWSVTVHANTNIFSRYDASQSDDGFYSHTFKPNIEPRWGDDRYIFPLFENVSGKRQESGNTKADASASVSRTPLLPVQVGFSLLDKDGNILQTKYDNRTYKYGSLFDSYSCELSNLKSDEKYKVRPSVKLFGYDVLASPSAEIEKQESAKECPVVLSDFKVTNKQYKERGFTNDGMTYDYRFDVSVTATLENSEDVQDWGYVYRDPNGREKEISLVQPSGYGTTYTDTRWAYYRNEARSTCTLYGYVKYVGSDEPVYGEPHDYPLEYGETSCPDNNHPHWIDLGIGTQWRCCNAGASSPEDYGGYYTFDQAQAYNPPSFDQIKALLNKCTSTWTQQNGVNGRKFTGPNGGTIFLPAAGRVWDGALLNVGTLGYYWSSTPYDEGGAYGLYFNSDYAYWGYYWYRSSGRSVRPAR